MVQFEQAHLRMDYAYTKIIAGTYFVFRQREMQLPVVYYLKFTTYA